MYMYRYVSKLTFKSFCVHCVLCTVYCITVLVYYEITSGVPRKHFFSPRTHFPIRDTLVYIFIEHKYIYNISIRCTRVHKLFVYISLT